MPLAIMPYRSHLPAVQPHTASLTVPKQSKLHKSSSNRSLYDGTKYVLGALAGLLKSNNQHADTSIDSTDDDNSDCSENDEQYGDMDLCDFLPTSTRSFTPLQHSTKQIHSSDSLLAQQQSTNLYTSILGAELNHTTDMIVNSIKHILKNSIESRILILGEYAEQRSRYIARTIDCVPIDVMKLNDMNNQSIDINHGVILYSHSIYDICLCENNQIDAILLFDIKLAPSNLAPQWLYQLCRVIKYNGVVAGTGLFKSSRIVESNVTPSNSVHSNDSDDSVSNDNTWSLREFRSYIESTGLDVHTAIDLTLEGYNNQYVSKSMNTLYGRFLATKPSISDDDNIDYTHKNDILDKIESTNSFLHILPTPTSTPEPIQSIDEYIMTSRHSTPPYTRSHSTNNESPTSILRSQHNIYEAIGITGISIGLPNSSDPTRNVFDSSNIDRLINGEQQITLMSEFDKNNMVKQNVFQLVKRDDQRVKSYFDTPDSVLQVSSKLCGIDLYKQYNIPPHVIDALDLSFQYAIAAGIEALHNANINIYDESNNLIGLPPSMQNDTGIIFASSFPGLDSIVQEVTQHIRSQYDDDIRYEYDRKLLFKILVLANCQLAELIHARGPNTQINAACAGTTQAITLANDWIKLNRCKRVIVISSDVATSDTLNSYLSSGFMALGAATKSNTIYNASAPFDIRRNGMIMGSGAVSLIVESKSSIQSRQLSWHNDCKAQLIASHIANSAYHACLMDKLHITAQLQQFISTLESDYGIDRHELAYNLLYYSHETGTGVCAAIELYALQNTFHESYYQIKIANTKGFTGHAMSVAYEECMAVHAIHKHVVPPIANLQQIDPKLDLHRDQLVTGGYCHKKYVLRFAAGFGSQLAYTLYSQPQ